MIFRVIKRYLDREDSVEEESDHINILRVINCHQWTLSKGALSYLWCLSVCVFVS